MQRVTCLCVLLLCALRAGADQMVRTRVEFTQQNSGQQASGQKSSAQISEQTEYRQGQAMRTEWNGRVSIADASGRRFQVDPRAREYTEQHSDWLLTLAFSIQRQRVHESGRTVTVRYRTSDTGERRQFFGHAAAHLMVQEDWSAPPGACAQPAHRVRDGWYAEGPGISSRSAFLGITGGIVYKDNIVIVGKAPGSGFPFVEARSDENSRTTWTVLAYSDAPLDPSLFRVPPAYQRVECLDACAASDWNERLRLDWRLLTEALESWWG